MPDIGDKFRSTVYFTNVLTGAATDPTTIVFKLKEPDGTETTYTYGVDSEVVKSSTGVYYADFTANAARRWVSRWNGTGSAVAATEQVLNISQSAFSSP